MKISPVCARRGLFSAEAIPAARAENRKMRNRDSRFVARGSSGGQRNGQEARGKVINRSESASKKAEGKKRRSPCTPSREKGKGKEGQTGFLKETVFRAGARVGAMLDADLDTAVRAFHGSSADRRIWAAIAWRVGVEAFHFALMDKLAEDAVDKPARRPAAAFQAFLNERFPKAEGGAA